MLRVNELNFSYGEKKILSDVSFEVGADQIVSLLGPNGAGKTTLLKCLCNLIKPESGSVYVDGEDVTGVSPREFAKRVAYVPQKTHASRVTVFDSVLIGRKPHIEWSVTRKDLAMVWDAMTAMGLDDLSLRYVNEISGGEFQKVQITRAIAQEPKLLLLDEPTNNLDISNQHITMHIVENIVRGRGVCTVMTMHDINLALHYSDKFLFMKDGKVFAFGGPEVVTEEVIESVYGIKVEVIKHNGTPLVVPCKLEKGSVCLKYLEKHEHPHDFETPSEESA